MARDPDALKIRKWAASGDVEDPEDGGVDRATGWDASHSQPGGSLPKREHFNELEREITALGVEVNAHGLLEWNSSVSYVHPAYVVGSDNRLYVSVRNNAGVDPTTDIGEADWKPVIGTTDGTIDAASTTEPGAVELATNLETQAGTDSTRAVTPAGVAAAIVAFLPTGTVLDYGGTTTPTGFLACDGAAVSRTTYSDLFTAIGTTWGAGDGSTTFNVPDLRRRTAIGSGGTQVSGPLTNVGNTGGSETHALSTSEMPSHSHTVPGKTHGTASGHRDTTKFSGASSAASNFTVSISSTGGGGAHNTMQPSAVVLKIIKT